MKTSVTERKNCSCQGCEVPDCICAGCLDANARSNCNGNKNCVQGGCSYAVKHRAASTGIHPLSVGEKSAVVLIPADQLCPHPDNPRKNLGNLTELADSIKANGILQNLTIVPKAEGGYTVVIGHRRLAAAKLAGLEVLPCIIADMDLRTQVQTMLTENIQRSDLSVYEQAQGFQMMLNLGDSIDEIARKSGFSQTTVRRRVKMMELDQDELKKVSSRQISPLGL